MVTDANIVSATLLASEAPKIPAASAKEKPSNIVIHHLNESRSQRILWLLEELEVPYTIVKYVRGKDRRAPKELRDIHPLGKAPVLSDGDMTIAESGAIVEYLISQYGEKFRPTEAGKMDDIYFCNYSEGSLMPKLIIKYLFPMVPQEMIDLELKAHCALVESALEKSETGWLAGGDHPTAADFMMMLPAEVIAMKLPFSGPKVKEYAKRIHQRPAYTRAIEKGGEYEYSNL